MGCVECGGGITYECSCWRQSILDDDYNYDMRTDPFSYNTIKSSLSLDDVKPAPITELYVIVHMAENGEWGQNKVTFCKTDEDLKAYMLKNTDTKKVKIFKGHEVEISFDVNIKAK